MAEYIEREATCKDCVHYDICIFHPKGNENKYCVRFKNKADVVEVVRCKDCQYAKPYDRNDGQMGYYCQHQNCTFLYGTNWERLFDPIKEANDFCSYGKKMDGKDGAE